MVLRGPQQRGVISCTVRMHVSSAFTVLLRVTYERRGEKTLQVIVKEIL